MIPSSTALLLAAAGLGAARGYTNPSPLTTPNNNAPTKPSIAGGVVGAPAAPASSSRAGIESPLSELLDLTEALGPEAARHNAAHPDDPIRLLAKAEFRNPASQSHKDRIARAILREAAARGDLTGKDGKRKTILAASSGNTGTAMARIGTEEGYDVTIITNKLCSQEKCDKIREGGAKLWMAEDLPDLFPDILSGVNCYMDQERVICENRSDEYYSVNQYENFDNMMAHYDTTAQEIWEQSERQVSHFVMAASTGGTIMGVGKYLKERNRDIQVVLSDPHKSRLAGILAQARGDVVRGQEMLEQVDAWTAAEGGVQTEGAGKQSLTKIMEADGEVLKYVDEALPVHDFDAFDMCRQVEASHGFRIGGSAGLNVVACRELAARAAAAGRGATLATLLCDDGNKYASKIFDDAWMAANDPRPRK